MSCIVLDTELPDKNIIKEFGVFIDGEVQGCSFRPPKKYKPTKQTYWCTKNLHGNVWSSGRLDNSELSKNLPRAAICEYFAKGIEKRKLLGNLLKKEVKNLEDHGCPEVQDLVDEEVWICSSFPFRHKTTLHRAARQIKLFGN